MSRIQRRNTYYFITYILCLYGLMFTNNGYAQEIIDFAKIRAEYYANKDKMTKIQFKAWWEETENHIKDATIRSQGYVDEAKETWTGKLIVRIDIDLPTEKNSTYDIELRMHPEKDKAIVTELNKDEFIEFTGKVSAFNIMLGTLFVAIDDVIILSKQSPVPSLSQQTIFKQEQSPTKENEKKIHEEKSTVIYLRNRAMTVSVDEAERVFGVQIDKNSYKPLPIWRPIQYVENKFEVQGDVVTDHATRLMWQKLQSSNSISFDEAENYIKKLNQDHFAGYNDWRLPTVNELLSLMLKEKDKQTEYLNPIFVKHTWLGYEGGKANWTADSQSTAIGRGMHPSNWYVSFYEGYVSWTVQIDRKSVRAVRSLQ